MTVKRIDIEGIFGSISQNQRFEQLFGFTPFQYSVEFIPIIRRSFFHKLLRFSAMFEKNITNTTKTTSNFNITAIFYKVLNISSVFTKIFSIKGSYER